MLGPPPRGILRNLLHDFGCRKTYLPKQTLNWYNQGKETEMSKNLPTATPAEVLEISPESLEIANCYLQNQDVQAVAEMLEIPAHMVTVTLARKDVKAYIDQVFFDVGFNNRFKMRAAMDALIKKKFQELEEADIGSNKDISELLALSHKMSMDQLDRQIELEKVRSSQVRSQVNVQINEGIGDGSKYGKLIQQLVSLPSDQS